VTLRPELPRGALRASLAIRATAAAGTGSAAERTLELSIHGDITGRVSVEGHGFESGNRLELGTIWRGESRRRTVAIFVRGLHQDLNISEIHARPEFLKVQVEAREQISAQLSRYKVHIDIPADAPIAHCLGAASGEIRLSTNHPDAPKLRWSVDFAVLERP
jgi:hypothetical protein